MTSEDQTLLYKAAADPNGQIALKRSRCGEWHADRDRLDVLARCGHLLSLGERMGPHLGGTFALWQITPVGRALAAMPVQPYGAEPTTDESVAQPCSADRGVPS